jgi:hypothetical protein
LQTALTSSNKPFDGLDDKISAIRGFYESSLNHPDVRALAEDLAFDAKAQLDIEGFFDKLRSLVRYLPDPTGAEFIKAPWVMVGEIHDKGYAVGDCDDLASLAYSLLHSVGVGAVLYVGWYGGHPNPSHIFVGIPQKVGGYTPFDLVADRYGQTKEGRTGVKAYA